MLKIGRQTFAELDPFVNDAHSQHDLGAIHLQFVQHLKRMCSFCHGYGHTEGRCTTRRAMWREANALSLRGTMGYLCGKLKVDQCETGMLRKRMYDQNLLNDREDIRTNVGRKQYAPPRAQVQAPQQQQPNSQPLPSQIFQSNNAQPRGNNVGNNGGGG